MQLSTDEARALAFIGCLIGLALLGRWVDRPKPLLEHEQTVDIAELRERSVAAAEGRQTRATRPPSAPAAGARARPSTAPLRAGAGQSSSAPIRLNAASVEQLETLPGVGPALAARIVAYRDSLGGFRSAAQLDSVRGIGPALMAKLLPLVQVP